MPADALAELAQLLYTTWERGVPVVAFYGAYDFTVLDRELGRHLGSAFEARGPVVDPAHHRQGTGSSPWQADSRRDVPPLSRTA
jgi:hypothetical protein